jgi:hypothetical protein
VTLHLLDEHSGQMRQSLLNVTAPAA